MSLKINLYLELLEEQYKILEQMIDIGLFKRTQIIISNIEELNSILKKENEFSKKLQEKEDQRCELQKELVSDEGTQDILTANRMMQYLKDFHVDKVEKFSTLIRDLEESMLLLQQINKENQELLQISLAYINDLQNILSADDGGIYNERGDSQKDKENNPKFRLVDKKA